MKGFRSPQLGFKWKVIKRDGKTFHVCPECDAEFEFLNSKVYRFCPWCGNKNKF